MKNHRMQALGRQSINGRTVDDGGEFKTDMKTARVLKALNKAVDLPPSQTYERADLTAESAEVQVQPKTKAKRKRRYKTRDMVARKA